MAEHKDFLGSAEFQYNEVIWQIISKLHLLQFTRYKSSLIEIETNCFGEKKNPFKNPSFHVRASMKVKFIT